MALKMTMSAKVAPKASPLAKVASVAAVSAASLLMAFSANAAVVKLGADSGALVFEPATLTIKSGETVEFINNKGFPHNVVFDEDGVPAGVDADAISTEDYLNAAGDKHVVTFDKAGTYDYYCEPHKAAQMVGKIIVQ